jgi:hypothetical protein
MIKSRTTLEQAQRYFIRYAILDIPAGQWFAPDHIASQGQLVTMVKSQYERASDGARLENKGQFLFRWQVAEEQEEEQ